jgi:segregation and condensation protein A
VTATSFEAPGSLSQIDFAPESSFIVELPHFSGPLDLLLTLIREEQVEITDIPIARICDQFLLRIHSLGLGEAAESLEMAKLGECRVRQPRPFADVEISRDAASEAA